MPTMATFCGLFLGHVQLYIIKKEARNESTAIQRVLCERTSEFALKISPKSGKNVHAFDGEITMIHRIESEAAIESENRRLQQRV